MGFAQDKFQKDWQFVNYPAALPASYVDGTGAAAAAWRPGFPAALDKIAIKEFGFELGADTSAAVTMTTRGVLSISKVLISSGAATELTTVTVPYSTLSGTKVVCAALSGVSTALTKGASIYDTAPAYPEVDLSLYYILVSIKTQGVGGTQQVKPYIVYSIVPKDDHA